MQWTEARGRAIVYERAGGRCEAAVPGVCLGTIDSVHHRRKAGRVWNPANLLAVCGDGTTGCHGWIEHHPDKAREDGLWVDSTDDPLEVSVHMRWENARAWWFLDDEGILHYDESEFEPLVPSWGASPLHFSSKQTR